MALTPEALPSTLATLTRLGIRRIDTAAVYPTDSEIGGSECALAEAGAPAAGFTIDTKVIWTIPVSESSTAGTMTAAKVRESAAASAARLRVDSYNILYSHSPDMVTPLEEQVEALEEQRRLGICKETGVSNFPPEMVEEWVSICKKGYKVPAVYQGSYSLVLPQSEEALFPVLRRHGIAFFAYSPLASGFLSGKLTAGTAEPGSRFVDPGWESNLIRGIFDRPELHAAIKSLKALIEETGVSPIGATLRWICYHSALRAELGDGIILGASKIEQVEQNGADIEAGLLPDNVVAGIEEIWNQIKSAGKA